MGEVVVTSPFGTVAQAIEDIRAGKLIIVADDEDRENEGDLIGAADSITPEMVTFMTKRGSGLLCLALPADRCDALGLAAVSENNVDAYRTAYTVSIDAAPRFGVTTGISANDRAITIRTAADPATTAADLVFGGHVHPLRARAGGVLERVGHTEAAIDLARLAGRQPAGVICEILRDDNGQPARRPELERFAKEHQLTFITVAQLVAHRLQNERLVHRVAEARLPTEWGEWRIIGYENDVDAHEHVALIFGDVHDGEHVLARMHSRCLTGDVFGSQRCDCGWQLQSAMQHDQRGGARRGRVSRPGGARHRAPQQAARVRTAGCRSGHGGGQRAAGLQGGSPQLRHRRADPARPGAQVHPSA